jgi:hypothetical protein
MGDGCVFNAGYRQRGNVDARLICRCENRSCTHINARADSTKQYLFQKSHRTKINIPFSL